MILAYALLLAAIWPHSSAGVAGLYVTNQMEMAGALELQPQGRFRYRFDYGAVSEEAEGVWTSDGRSVRLTSEPMPRLPAFTLLSDDPAPSGQLFVAIDNPPLRWSPLEVEVTPAGGGAPIAASAGEDGRVDLPEGVRAAAVRLLFPVYESAGEPVKLEGDRGHRLLFRLDPNDFGKAAFRGEAMPLDAGAIIMHRYETTIVFRRADK
ncbi:MAG: hypothetical protein ACLGHC_07865 [Alphaproteobacteria bacterium]